MKIRKCVMKTIKWNEDWKFWRDEHAFALVWNIPEHATEVTLPHDSMISQVAYEDSQNMVHTGFRDGENLVYVKHYQSKPEDINKKLMLKFEGVYMNAFVYVNEQLAAQSPFGYTTFYVPLNPYLRIGEINEIRVIVKNKNMSNSRWYSGSGIYRDVYFLESETTYLVPEGTQIETTFLSNELGVVQVKTEVKNEAYHNQHLLVETRLYNQEKQVVAIERTPLTLFGQSERYIRQQITVSMPLKWSADTPNLYTCTSRLLDSGTQKCYDTHEERFGMRMMRIDAKQGLRINDEVVKLRGACIHHDSGLLGAATYEDAQYRQVKKLKEAGFNSIRMAHHPMAPAMLRACDEIGMYVMDETFDMWTRHKSDFDYSLYFQTWWEKDVEAMVRKDFNHPSVILYSLGNEIPEVATDLGAKVCYELNEKVKALDPTRYTLVSVNGVFAAGEDVDVIVKDVVSDLEAEGFAVSHINHFMALMDKHMDRIVMHDAITKRLEIVQAQVDISGYNYMAARYETDGHQYPNRVIVGSETYPPEIARNWRLVDKLNHVIGDFTWTGWDYIGEAGVGIPAYQLGEGGFGAKFPCQLAYCGDIDLLGYRRPLSYYREIVFGLRQEPYIAVQKPEHYGKTLIKTPWILSDTIHSWSFQGYEGQPVVVEVYGQGDEVELYINDTCVGRQAIDPEGDWVTRFEVNYQSGQIKTLLYKNKLVIGDDSINTASETGHLVIASIEKFQELVYITFEYQDTQGRLITNQDVTFEVMDVDGGILLGLGSSNPKYDIQYTSKQTNTFQGRAMAVCKKKNDEEIKLTYVVKNDII